jgi:hypothetical protein
MKHDLQVFLLSLGSRGGRPTLRRDLQAFLLSLGSLLAVAGSGLLMLRVVLS